MSDRSLMLNDPAAYYANVGAQAERKRIIKLLEESIEQEKNLLNWNPNRTDFKQRHNKISIAKQFIALIKGENQ